MIYPEATTVIEAMLLEAKEIFPFSVIAVSAAFTRVCKLLGVDDLHFHDLRQDGISRLFEMSRKPQQAFPATGVGPA